MMMHSNYWPCSRYKHRIHKRAFWHEWFRSKAFIALGELKLPPKAKGLRFLPLDDETVIVRFCEL